MFVALMAAVPLLFGIDADTASMSASKSALMAQGFRQISKPAFDAPQAAPNATIEEQVDALKKALTTFGEKTEWLGFTADDMRFVPGDKVAKERHVTLSQCPATGELAMITVRYKSTLSAEEFNSMMKGISQRLKMTPKVRPSQGSLTVEWLRPGGERYALAMRSSHGPEPLITVSVYGKPSAVDCQRGFWLSQ